MFNALDLKRMGDLRYALTIIITMMSGYFNRDDAFGDFLERYNDDFPHEPEIDLRITRTLEFIDECGFQSKSRVWRKADLFSFIVELDNVLMLKEVVVQPSHVLDRIDSFYSRIDTSGDMVGLPAIYYKAALQASNDRANRVRRGTILFGVLKGQSDDQILASLDNYLLQM
ncbi:MAG: hypothetical protein IPJ98_09850 [Bryobacterales bacterium]|nr:hypothetical protein [Bryobacterales bacterium]